MAHQLCEPAKLLPTEVAQPIPRQDLQGGLYLVEIFPNFCGVGLEHDGTEQLSFETQSSAPAPKRLKLGSAPELFLLQCLGDNSNATASNRCFNKAASICLPECFLKGLDRKDLRAPRLFKAPHSDFRKKQPRSFTQAARMQWGH